MSTPALPVVVVGTGFGCRIQVPALRATGFKVVGLVGTDAERTAQRALANGVPQAFTDLDEAIVRTGAVAVAVAVPPHQHAPQIMTALSHGCHVLCEKPFAMNAHEARAMLQAAERARVVHVIGHEFRWAPERVMGARLIADGRIGQPRFLTFTQFLQHVVNPTADMPHWWFDPAYGGGWLGAAGSHLVDWVRTWVGEFESLSASLSTLSSREGGADDSFTVRFRLANGAEGVLQQTAAAWGPTVDIVRVAGTQGTVWLDGSKVWVADRQAANEVSIAADVTLPPIPALSDDPRQKSPNWQWLVKVELPPYMSLCQAWRSAIEGGTPSRTVPLPTFADGVACMDVLDAIRTSAANGGALVSIGQQGG